MNGSIEKAVHYSFVGATIMVALWIILIAVMIFCAPAISRGLTSRLSKDTTCEINSPGGRMVDTPGSRKDNER